MFEPTPWCSLGLITWRAITGGIVQPSRKIPSSPVQSRSPPKVLTSCNADPHRCAGWSFVRLPERSRLIWPLAVAFFLVTVDCALPVANTKGKLRGCISVSLTLDLAAHTRLYVVRSVGVGTPRCRMLPILCNRVARLGRLGRRLGRPAGRLPLSAMGIDSEK